MTPTAWSARFLVSIAVASLISGCERAENSSGTPAPSGSAVHITSVSPSIGETLYVGDKVRLQVSVDYTLTAESGTLSLVVQASDNSLIAHNVEVVTKGSGKVDLETVFVVPSTRTVQIFTPLAAQGQSSTSTVESRAFKVVPR
jgi:hypothetical protein